MRSKTATGAEVARYVVGVILLASATGKLLDNRGFADVIASFQVLPDQSLLLLPLGLAISLAELAIALALLSRRRVSLAAGMSVLLHLTYGCWLVLALARGLDLGNCGCFGVFLPMPLGFWSPIEDLVLACLSALVFFHHRRRAPS